MNDRFSQSVPVKPWTDIKSAEQYGPQCTQPLVFCSDNPSKCNTEVYIYYQLLSIKMFCVDLIRKNCALLVLYS